MIFETRRLKWGVDLAESAALDTLWSDAWMRDNTVLVTFEAPDIEAAESLLPIGFLRRPYLCRADADAGNRT